MSAIRVFGQCHTSSFMKRIMSVIKTNEVCLMLGFPLFLWVFVCFLISSSSGGYLLEIIIQSTFWQGTVMQDKIKLVSKFTLDSQLEVLAKVGMM